MVRHHFIDFIYSCLYSGLISLRFLPLTKIPRFLSFLFHQVVTSEERKGEGYAKIRVQAQKKSAEVPQKGQATWCSRSRRRTAGSISVRARQDPGRDSGRSAPAERSGVRMRREQSPLTHRSPEHGGVRAPATERQRRASERRSPAQTRGGAGENAARKWACLESLIGPAEEGTKPPCPMGGQKSPLSIASSPPSTLRYLSTSTSFLTVAQAAHLRHPRK